MNRSSSYFLLILVASLCYIGPKAFMRMLGLRQCLADAAIVCSSATWLQPPQ